MNLTVLSNGVTSAKILIHHVHKEENTCALPPWRKRPQVAGFRRGWDLGDVLA